MLYTCDDQRGVDVEQLADFLSRDHDFKYATVVHCDTPSGVLNDIGRICPLLHQYGILTVVDSVAAMFGEVVKVDDWQIDILCGGSQKALSAAPGLTSSPSVKRQKQLCAPPNAHQSLLRQPHDLAGVCRSQMIPLHAAHQRYLQPRHGLG